MEKKQKPVWFNEKSVNAFEKLNLPESFSEFVKNAFYNKLTSAKKEVTLNEKPPAN